MPYYSWNASAAGVFLFCFSIRHPPLQCCKVGNVTNDCDSRTLCMFITKEINSETCQNEMRHYLETCQQRDIPRCGFIQWHPSGEYVLYTSVAGNNCIVSIICLFFRQLVIWAYGDEPRVVHCMRIVYNSTSGRSLSLWRYRVVPLVCYGLFFAPVACGWPSGTW